MTREDVESCLIRMNAEYQEIAEGMYLVELGEMDVPAVVHVTPPLVVIRIKVMDLPDREDLRPLYRTLLEWNASDVVHGAYAIEEEELILTDALQLESLDFTELQASLESLQIAATSHMGRIGSFLGTEGEG